MSGGIAPRTFNVGTRRRIVVSFRIRPIYSRGKGPRYALDGRQGGSQGRCGRGGEEKGSLRCSYWELIPGCPAPSSVSIVGLIKIWLLCTCSR